MGFPCSFFAVQENQVQSLGQQHPLKKGLATHSSILGGRIPWTEPDGLKSIGSQRIGLQANRRKTMHDKDSKKKKSLRSLEKKSLAWRQATTNPSLLSIYIVASFGHLAYGIEHYVVFCDCLPFLSVVWLNFTHVVTWAEFHLFYSHIHCVNILFCSYIHQMMDIWFVSTVVLL